jgi:triosephosphate isomerase
MRLLFQKMVDREDLRRNPQVLYVFGDNVRRVGYGGQARAMRGEKNAVGVATKYSPAQCFGETPAETEAQNRIIDNDMKPLFEHLKEGGVVIWPADGIGTGLADLPNKAPDTFDYLQQKLAALLKTADMFGKGPT